MARRDRERGGSVRSTSKVGPNYAEGRYDAPWNADIDKGEFGSDDSKSVCSVAESTYAGGGAPMNKGKYDPLWDGKK